MAVALRSAGPAIVDLARVGRGLGVTADIIADGARLGRNELESIGGTVVDAGRALDESAKLLEQLRGTSPHARSALDDLTRAKAALGIAAETWVPSGASIPDPTIAARLATVPALRRAQDAARASAVHIDEIPGADLQRARAVGGDGARLVEELPVPGLDDPWVGRDVGGFQRAMTSAGQRLLPDRMIIEGAENVPAGPVLLAPTHGATLDNLYMVSGMPAGPPTRVMAIDMLMDMPVVGSFAKHWGLFPVSRSAGGEAIARARAMLRNGERVAIYGEGRMVHAEHVGEPRRGLARVALAEGATVVPVATAGTKAAWVRGELPSTTRNVALVYGTPISFKGIPATRANVDAATERIWRGVDEAHARAQEIRRGMVADQQASAAVA